MPPDSVSHLTSTRTIGRLIVSRYLQLVTALRAHIAMSDSDSSEGDENVSSTNPKMTITIIDDHQHCDANTRQLKHEKFVVSRIIRFSKLKQMYAKRTGVDVNDLYLTRENRPVNDNDTPHSLNFKINHAFMGASLQSVLPKEVKASLWPNKPRQS